MKLLAATILTILLAFAGGLFLNWWEIALASFIVALVIPQSPWKAFLSGALGVFILWGVLAWWIDMKNEGLLSKKIATILPLGGSAALLILVTAVVGGLVGGLAGLSGSYLRGTR